MKTARLATVLFTRSMQEDLEAVPSLMRLSSGPKPKLEKALVAQFKRELDEYVPNHGVKSVLYVDNGHEDSYSLIATVKTNHKTTKALAHDIQARFYDTACGNGAIAGDFEVAR